MKLIVTGACAALFLAGAAPAFASPASDNLAKCVVDQSTGRDRTVLVQWLFAAMSKHPDLKDYARLSDDQRLATLKSGGEMIGRLLGQSCRKEFEDAYKADGQTAAIGAAFGKLGEVAMADLMTNPAVQRDLESLGENFPPEFVELLTKMTEKH